MKGNMKVINGGGLNTPLAVGHLYHLENEGGRLDGWVTGLRDDMVWFRDRQGKEFGFTVEAMNRMDKVQEITL